MAGVVERAQHAGDIAQHGSFLPAFGEGPRRLSFEVGDHEVVLSEQDLAEVIVAVQSRLAAAWLGRDERLDEPALRLRELGAVALRSQHQRPQLDSGEPLVQIARSPVYNARPVRHTSR